MTIISDWSERARRFGRRCVIDLDIPGELFEPETARQWEFFSKHLQTVITGDERRVLDWGCGMGRFTVRLADFLPGAEVLGYDPTAELINIAVPADRVSYSTVPPTGKFDLIWISGVLGGFDHDDLIRVIKSLAGLLAPSGQIFLTEVTFNRRWENGFWRVHCPEYYLEVFQESGFRIRHLDAGPHQNFEMSVYHAGLQVALS